MKPKEKRMILILVLITIIMFVILMVVRNNGKNNNLTNNGQATQAGLVKQENGTKQSVSSKLKEAKKIDNLDVTNINITEKNGEATITANITNNTNSNVKEFPIVVKTLNQKGEVIQEVGAYVGTIKAGETRAIHASVSMNIDEIYDVTFQRK